MSSESCIMMEKNDDLVCTEHKNPPKLILVDDNLDIKDRLVCEECLRTRGGGIQPKTLDQMKQIILERVQKKNHNPDILVGLAIKQAEYIQKKIDDLESKIQSQLDSIKTTAEKLVSSLRQFKKENFKYSFFAELEAHVQNKEISDQEIVKKMQEFNLNWFGKIKQKLTSLPESFNKLLDPIRISTLQFYQKNYDEINKPLEVQLIENNKIKQRDPCYTLAFNKDNNLLFTGSGKQVKVWSFDQGKIQEVTRLNGHILTVTCIVTSSKVKNSFVSGSECGQLIIWKQITEKEWESNKQKSQWPNAIILNKDETEIIIATSNANIEIWKVDFNQNYLELKQTLDEVHSNNIFDISLNNQQNRMISCGDDNKYMIWKKEKQDQEWTQLSELTSNAYGTKVAFISDSSFIWIRRDVVENDKDNKDKEMKQKEDTISYYDIDAAQQSNNNKKVFKFDQDDKFIDFHLTPIIYNDKKKVYFIRFKRHIYILKLDQLEFQLVTKLQFESNLIYATLSEDGEYVVAYLEDKQQYQVNKIIWKK